MTQATTGDTPRWRLEMLGGLRIYQESACDGHWVSALLALPKLRKAQALLALLALLEPGESLSREELVEHLWPGDAPEETRDRLRQTIYVLRRLFEPHTVLNADRLTVGLQSGLISSDVSVFSAGLRTAVVAERTGDNARQIDALTAALRAYQGELLPGFYEEYLLARREALGERRLEALLTLTARLLARGDAASALPYARDAVAADPLHEECHAALLRTYAALDRRAEVVRHFREAEAIFRRELDAALSPTLHALFKALSAAPSPAVPSPPRAEPGPEAPAATSETNAPTLAVTPTAEPVRCPTPLTRFFGRETEMGDLHDLLFGRRAEGVHAPRVVTLTGPGGAGKTRLAIETAAALPGGIVTIFAALAETAEPERIGDVLAEAVGALQSPSEPPIEAAARVLAERVKAAVASDKPHAAPRGVLLLLDNFEQLADHGAASIVELLRAFAESGGDGRGLALLVTSRQRLDISGEQEYAVEPLPTPRSPGSPDRLSEFASVQLFVDRVRAVRSQFALDATNAGDVGELCRRLDGLPLAIELAAAWASVLTPGQILQRLNRRFDLLISRRVDLPDRHRSLRAAIESNLSLQTPELRRLFAQLSTFRGGWSLDAAESVCAETDEERWTILERLAALERRSLIVSAPNAQGEIRFNSLESLRTYGQEMIQREPPEIQEALIRRHAQYFSRCVLEQGKAIQDDAGATAALKAIDADMDNIRAAIAFLLESDPENALWLTSRLWRYLEIRGMSREGIVHMEAALQASGRWSEPSSEQREARAGAMAGLANMLAEEGHSDRAEALYVESMEIWRSLDRSVDVAISLSNLALIDRDAGRYERGRTRCEEALEIFRRTGNVAREAICLTALGVIATCQKDFDFARRCHEQSLTLKRTLGNPLSIANSLNCLGHNALSRGDTKTARYYCGEALKLRREHGDLQGTSSSVENLAECEFIDGNLPRARALRCEELSLEWEIGRLRKAIATIEWLALLAFRLQDATLSTKLLASAAAMRRRHKLFEEVSNAQSGMSQTLNCDLQNALPKDDYAREWHMGETLSDSQTIALALQNTVRVPALL